MKALIFYRREAKEKLAQGRLGTRFGKLTHFESVGMILTPDAIDTKGITLIIADAKKKRIYRTMDIPKLRGLLVYYIET